MAEATGVRNNAMPYPLYGCPFAVVFPMLDADGDPVTGATTPDAEVSLNCNTFADCTNESTEIATASGVYYLLLTAAEMTADIVTVIAKSATAGMKTTVITLYPRKLVSIRTGTSASAGSLTSSIVLDASASAVDDFYNGMICVAVIDGTTEVRMISDYTGSTQTATVVPDWNTAPDNNDTFTVYLPDGVQIQQANASHWNSLATVELPLVPTTAGRKLDVSAGGEAGIDWANVGGQSTSVNLSATTTNLVNTATTLTNLPAITAGWLTATGIAADAFTAAKFAADCITAAKIADGAIDAATFAAGAITATVIATGAIDADALATDGVQEIRDAITGGAYALSTDANGRIRIVDGTATGEIDTSSGAIAHVILTDTTTTNTDMRGTDSAALASLWTSTRAGYVDNLSGGAVALHTDITGLNNLSQANVRSAVGLATANLDTQFAVLQADTDDIQTRLPAALVSGRMDASVGAMAANTLTASALATDAAQEIRNAITGGSYALDTDANGRIRIVDGTAAGELDTTSGLVTISGTIQTLDALNTAQIVEHDATQSAIAALNNIAAADVWAVATRVLTAGTNIVLAKGTGVTGFNDLSAAAVNAEVVDALATDTYAEPGQDAPGATISLAAKLNWLYTSWRNKKDNDGSTTNLYADDGSTVLAKQLTSVDAGVVTKAEWITGA